MMFVTGHCKGAQGATMEPIGERNDGFAAFNATCKFQCRFDGIGAGRTGKLHFVFHVARLEDFGFKCFKEIGLCFGVHVQAMGNAVRLDVVNQLFLQNRMVMAIVQAASTGKEIKIAVAVFVGQPSAL